MIELIIYTIFVVLISYFAGKIYAYKECRLELQRLKYELSGEYDTPFEEWRKKNVR